MRLVEEILTLARDARHSLRALRRAPTFTLTAVLSLALGIGATTMVYSAVYGVVLEPFPYKDPDTLISVNFLDERGFGYGSNYSIDEFLEIAEHSPMFSHVMASTISDVLMIGTGEPERLRGNYVTL